MAPGLKRGRSRHGACIRTKNDHAEPVHPERGHHAVAAFADRTRRCARGAGALAAGASVRPAAAQSADIDVGILNFALNLEYLEGEFYHRAAHGTGLPNIGKPGTVTGGAKVPRVVPGVAQLIAEIAHDETNHVNFLRTALGPDAVAEPDIDFTGAFLAIGEAIGLPGFNPFNDELSFLIGAYIFEDVGVTAYNGAAPLITDRSYLGAAASILAVEAYHAAGIRTLLFEAGAGDVTDKISAFRAAASGTGPGTGKPADDQGTSRKDGRAHLVPADTNSLAFARTPEQVLSIVFDGGATSGGFFPNGVAGMFTSSVG